MIKKSIVIAFLSILYSVSVKAESQPCTITLPETPEKEVWQVYVKDAGPEVACRYDTSTYSFHTHTGNLLPIDWIAMPYYICTGDKYCSSYSFSTESVELKLNIDRNYPNPCTVNPGFETKMFSGNRVVLTRVNSLGYVSRLTLGFTGFDTQVKLVPRDKNSPYPPTPVICSPPPDDDECPDLNLRITGTVLPVRRGTARVSGDWCKSLGCDGKYKFLKTDYWF